jgi:hypothetical protein
VTEGNKGGKRLFNCWWLGRERENKRERKKRDLTLLSLYQEAPAIL